MKKFISVVIIAIFLIFSFSLIGYAEIVVMNDGTEYKGNIHHQDDSVVFIVCGEDIIKLNKTDIKEIKEDKKNKNSIFDKTDVVKKNNETIIQIGYDFYGEYLHKGHEAETDFLILFLITGKRVIPRFSVVHFQLTISTSDSIIFHADAALAILNQFRRKSI